MSISGMGLEAWSALLSLLLPFLAAVFCIFMRPGGRVAFSLYFLWLGGGCVAAWIYFLCAPLTDQVYIRLSWLQMPGVHLHLGLAHTAATACLVAIVSSIGLVTAFYSVGYLYQTGHATHRARYFGHVALFLFGMQVLLLAPSLFQFFLGWEIMGLCSYLLIGFSRESQDGPPAASKAFMYNRVGDASFVGGICIVVAIAGTTDFQALQTLHQEQALPTFWLSVAGFCWVVASAAKSAQFPLHGWLPDAMAGPTPVSALIHAATMVVAGVLLLHRMLPFMDMEHVQWIGGMAAATALLGAVQALQAAKLKQVLAWSTVSQLGWMLLILSMGGVEGSLSHLYAHAFFKAGLFLVAGLILSAAGQLVAPKDAPYIHWMRGIGGTSSSVLWLGVVFLLSLSGAPLSAAFLSKELSLHQMMLWWQTHQTQMTWFTTTLLTVALLTPMLTAWYSMRLFVLVFNPYSSRLFSGKPAFSRSMRIIPFVLVPGCTFLLLSWNPLAYQDSRGPVWAQSDPEAALFLLSIGLVGVGWLAGYFTTTVQLSTSDDTQESDFIRSLRLSLLSKLLRVLNSAADVFRPFQAERLTMKLAHLISGIQYFETHIVDRFVLLLAQAKVIVAQVAQWLDTFVADGLLKLIANVVYQVGPNTAEVQSGKLQGYLLRVVAVLMLGFATLALILLK